MANRTMATVVRSQFIAYMTDLYSILPDTLYLKIDDRYFRVYTLPGRSPEVCELPSKESALRDLDARQKSAVGVVPIYRVEETGFGTEKIINQIAVRLVRKKLISLEDKRYA